MNDDSILATPAQRLSEDHVLTEIVFLVDAEDENSTTVTRHQIPLAEGVTELGAVMVVVNGHPHDYYPLTTVTCVGTATTTLVMHAAEYSWISTAEVAA